MTKHGMSAKGKTHPLYDAWRNIKRRCYGNYKNSKYYKNYGGRGITVCDDWIHDFDVFYEWAINAGWKKGLTIERVDNDGNYSPSNCIWITQKEQLRNRRNNRYVTYNNKTMIAKDWAKELGISYPAFLKRLNNWDSIEKIIKEPLHIENVRT